MTSIKSLFNRTFFPKDSNPQHFKALDGLRGIAVLIVLLCHSSNIDMHFAPFLDFNSIGVIGVYLFFVLSAYLLDRQIALAIKNKKANLKYWINYFLRRFFRIYPLFFASLLFNFVIFQYDKTYALPIYSWEEIGRHLTLQAGIGVYWSIPVEFVYYFISPFILLFINYFLKWNISIVVLTLLFGILFADIINSIYNLEKISTIRFLPLFLSGTIISLIEIFSGAFNNLTKRQSKILGAFGLAAALIVIFTFRSILEFVFTDIKYTFVLPRNYALYGVLWGTLLLSAKYSKGIIYKILSFKPLRFIGVISFSVYLFHWPVMKFAAYSGMFPKAIQIYAYVIISVILSSITYLLIEKPMSSIRLKGV